jgi:hypothetical protein
MPNLLMGLHNLIVKQWLSQLKTLTKQNPIPLIFLKWNNSDYPLEEFYIFDFDFEIFNGCSYHNLALASM